VPIESRSEDRIHSLIDQPLETISIDDKKALITAVERTFDTLFTWNYEQGELDTIDALYKKAKMSQWDSDLDIDWSVVGQIERARDPNDRLNWLCATDDGVFRRLNAQEKEDFGHASVAWTISQFLHAEQGALACAAKPHADGAVGRHKVLRIDTGPG
jgi:hypothetical protein